MRGEHYRIAKLIRTEPNPNSASPTVLSNLEAITKNNMQPFSVQIVNLLILMSKLKQYLSRVHMKQGAKFMY